MKIRAAVLNAIGVQPLYKIIKPLFIEKVELNGCGYSEILARIMAAGIQS